ncbi:CASP-like protein 2C4 isoform X2 [Phragmites australis]|uniref:CASP-like protein 2C4 isoform X2 n=1 Tax=Phragmites australis TaxID=29695 RepID=UPI002D79E7F6|nr:CASP-like protein 2C4 isoform X2 [Phragmites australis]
MAGKGPPSWMRAESLLRGACAAMAAAGALLLGLSTETKTVLFVQKKAVPKDVQALWVLIVAAAAAAGYHVVQLASRCLYSHRFPGGGCRRLRRGLACVSFLLDKGCAYMVFATTAAALQACVVGLTGVEALQWSKLCNIYTSFCVQGAAGMLCSLLAAAGMAVLSVFSARDLFRRPCSSAAGQCAQI